MLGLARPNDDDLAVQTALRNVRRRMLGLDSDAPTVGRFVILGQLGCGAMGDVFEAYDPKLERKVALKVIRGQGTVSASRLLREARALARVSHPNVIAVYDAEAKEDRLFLAMELVRGQNLAQWLRSARRSQADIAAVFVDAGRGLRAAHAAGIVHGDFKPENVLVGDDGRVRVADFGLARSVEDSRATRSPENTAVTHTAQTGGTPAYMAPEVTAGHPATPQSDQYSFCVSLIEAIAGRRPIPGSATPPLVSKRITRLVRAGLSVTADDRLPDLDSLVSALERRSTRRPRRISAAILAVILAAAAAAGWHHYHQADPAEQCRLGASAFERAWDAQTKSALLARWSAYSPVAANISSSLDRYGERWREAHTSVCDATHTHKQQSMALLDRKMECLEQRRQDVQQLLVAWMHSDPDRSVPQAKNSVARLTAADDCLSSTTIGGAAKPADAALRGEVTAIDQMLSKTRSLRTQGKLGQAEALARAALVRAERTDFRPIIARALFELGYLLHDFGDPETLSVMRRAMTVAAQAGDQARAAEAGIIVLSALISIREYDSAEAIVPHVRAAVERSPNPRSRQARLDYLQGQLAARKGDLDRAEEMLRGAAESVAATIDPDIGWIITNELGNVLRKQGKLAQAAATLNETTVLAERAVGANHPQLAHALHSLGAVLTEQARYEEARAILERALAIVKAGHERNSVLLVALHSNLSGLEQNMGNYEAALRHVQAAIDAEAASSAPEVYRQKLFLSQHGRVLLSMGRAAEALSKLNRAIEGLEERYEEDPLAAEILAARGHAQQRLGNYKAAFADLQRAITITEVHSGRDHVSLASPLYRLGDLLRRRGDHRAARAACQRGLDVSLKALGPDHPSHVAGYTCLALAELALEHDAAAERAADLALKIANSAVGKQLATAAALAVKADVQWRDGNRCAAVELNQRASASAKMLTPGDDTYEEVASLRRRWRSRQAIGCD